MKPSYKIIYESIKNDILRKKFPIGSMLPSEAELEKQFNVSRTPVRQALKQLENDNYIYRQQGRGSFVANFRPKEKWINMTGFKRQYNYSWQKVTAQTLELRTIQSKTYAKALMVDEDEELIFLKRLRYLDAKPIFYMEQIIAPIVPIEIFQEDSSFTSIQQILSEKAFIELVIAEDTIEAVNAEADIADILEIPHGTALLKGSRISYSPENKPINLDVFYTNTEVWKYFSSYRY
ncbi:GntR family transcriptional regulator [Pseudogracilibacillus sp. SE30717A]|uniref:GntR family transcriptional regulator n=1 Tax=Pseudogracilibacillus sp. SE30717A TaxID=3098293 RepID=UPI00300E1F26